MNTNCDFLVLGSGLAGLSFALKVADHGTVAIICKTTKEETASKQAQGGIAAVLDPNDSPEDHIHDTLSAGCGLCDEAIVRAVVEASSSKIKDLIDWGVQFSQTDKGTLDLGQEGGHSRRRIAHAGDITGAEIQRALLLACMKHPNIQFYENHIAVDLITKRHFQEISPSPNPLPSREGITEKNTPLNRMIEKSSPLPLWEGVQGEGNQCFGAYILDETSSGVKIFASKITFLSTGGAGKVYLYTSNPDTACGDGMALAFRAGCRVANMEFVQFHPTCLFHREAKTFLLSEALRGEGAILKLKDGTQFLEKYDPRGNLATRDVVARAIDSELKKSGEDYVLLDITHKPESFVKERFPGIYKKCLEYGFDITQQPLPVVPAAHYFCGGVVTDTHGKTDLHRLLAAGEVAYTGLHGANRLASNSLLEACVFSDWAAKTAIEEAKKIDLPHTLPAWKTGNATHNDEQVVISQNWDEVRRLMWNYVGIVRSTKRLMRAKERVALLKKEIRQYYWDFILNRNLIELRNLVLVAELVIDSALSRKESRGLHYTLDYPESTPSQAYPTLLSRS